MEIENKTPNILLASPTGGKVDTGYLVSCLRLQKLINDKGWGLSFSFSISSYIHRERNKQALEFMSNDEYTHILYVDSDIEFEPTTVINMLELNKGIVCTIYPYKHFVNGAMRYMGEVKEGAELQKDNTIEMDKTGAGFLMIKKDTLKELIPFCGEVTYGGVAIESGDVNIENKVTTWNIFNFDIDNGVELGEDVSFCKRCKTAGIPIWALVTENLTHWGSHNFRANNLGILKHIDK